MTPAIAGQKLQRTVEFVKLIKIADGLTPMKGVKGKFQAGGYMVGQGLGLE